MNASKHGSGSDILILPGAKYKISIESSSLVPPNRTMILELNGTEAQTSQFVLNTSKAKTVCQCHISQKGFQQII